jgi:hypothetical protein
MRPGCLLASSRTPAQGGAEVGDDLLAVVREVVAGEADDRPARRDEAAVAPAVAVRNAAGLVDREEVELDHDPLGAPEHVTLAEVAVPDVDELAALIPREPSLAGDLGERRLERAPRPAPREVSRFEYPTQLPRAAATAYHREEGGDVSRVEPALSTFVISWVERPAVMAWGRWQGGLVV